MRAITSYIESMGYDYRKLQKRLKTSNQKAAERLSQHCPSVHVFMSAVGQSFGPCARDAALMLYGLIIEESVINADIRDELSKIEDVFGLEGWIPDQCGSLLCNPEEYMLFPSVFLMMQMPHFFVMTVAMKQLSPIGPMQVNGFCALLTLFTNASR